MQRAAVSIASNIAEGQQRASSKEFNQLLHVARGSAAELSTQVLLVDKLYNSSSMEILNKIDRVQKMLYGLINSLK